jgi:hypothetical protein
MPQSSLFGEAKRSEADVTDDVKKYLNARRVFWWRNQRGAYKLRSAWIQYGGTPGSADILGLWPGGAGVPAGTFWSLELKKPKGHFENDDQIKWLLDVRRMGGVASVAESIEDVSMALDNPGYLPERYQKAVDAYVDKTGYPR